MGIPTMAAPPQPRARGAKDRATAETSGQKDSPTRTNEQSPFMWGGLSLGLLLGWMLGGD